VRNDGRGGGTKTVLDVDASWQSDTAAAAAAADVDDVVDDDDDGNVGDDDTTFICNHFYLYLLLSVTVYCGVL